MSTRMFFVKAMLGADGLKATVQLFILIFFFLINL